MIRKVVLASLMTLTAATSFAGEHIWDFNKDSSINNSGYGDKFTFSSGQGMDVEVSAWSSTGSGCGTVSSNRGDDVYSCIQDAKLKSYNGGLGIQNRFEQDNTPNHAIDNTNDNNNIHPLDLDFDMVLFSFDHEVKLTGFGSGWQWHDYDASVVAYTGNNAFSNFGTQNWSDILNNGWSSIDAISKGQTTGTGNVRDFAVDDKNIFSKHWLVGTYNTAFGLENWSHNNDAFKLNGLSVVKKPDNPDTGMAVSAPATAGILFAMVGIMAYRRNR